MNHDDDEVWDDVRAIQDRLGPANPMRSAVASADQLAAGRAAVEASRRQGDLARDHPGDGLRSRRSRLWVLGAAAAVVAVTVAGVVLSLPGNGRNGTQAVLASYGATRDSGTARTAFTITGGGQSASVEGVGDLRTGDAAGTVNLPVVGRVRVLSVGSVLYVEVPEQFRQFTDGKPWASANSVNLLQLANAALGGIGLSQPFNPAEVLSYIRGVSGEVTDVGRETIRDATTTHYRASIDLSRVADRASPEAQPGLRGAVAAPRQPLPADLWVDDQGRLRKLTIVIPGPMPVTATFELWDFGVGVDAAAPPPDQVGELGVLG